MRPDCQVSQDALAAGERATFDAHARQCADCAAFARRLDRGLAALAQLARVDAPAELTGRVVAELEAGRREERAIESVRSLARVAVPEHLEHAVARTAAPAAPAAVEALAAPEVLSRLVEEELADPAKARVRRFVGSLERAAVPAELADRIEAALAKPRPRRWFRSRLIAGGLTLAFLAVLAVAWRADSLAAAKRHVEWVRVESASELSPFAASLAAGLTGGATELTRADDTRRAVHDEGAR
jgi:hypothetical protein